MSRLDVLFILITVLSCCMTVFYPAASVESLGNLEYDDILKMDYLHHFALTSDEENIVYLLTTGSDFIPPADNGTLMMEKFVREVIGHVTSE